MKKRKMLYFLVLIIIVGLTITGCSSGGGDSDLPGKNNSNLPGTSGSDSVSISGTITLPEDTTNASGLANGDDNSIFVEIKDFDKNKSLVTVEVNATDNGNYKYSVTDGIKAGQNLLVEVPYEKTKLLAYIPDVGKNSIQGGADVDAVSTFVTELIEEVRKNKKVKLTPEEVAEFKQKAKNFDKLSEKEIANLKDDIKDKSEANTGDIGSAKDMVSFVRNAGVFLEDSAGKHEKTIKDNMEIVSKRLGSFTKDFESELAPLFISNFANRAPNNYPGSPESYNLAQLKQPESMEINLEKLRQLPELKWTIKDKKTEEYIIEISTDSMKAFKFEDDKNGNPKIVSIDFSSAELDYKINNTSYDYYFDGHIDVDSSRTKTEQFESDNNEVITVIIPEKSEGDIVGKIKTSDLEEPANIDIKLSEDSHINDDNIVGDVSWDGIIELPGLIKYDGTLAYQGKIIEKSYPDEGYSKIYYDYLNMQFKGEINTFATKKKEINKGLKIDAKNLEIKTQSRNGQLELDRISLAGYFVDKPKTSLWSGDLTANFEGKASRALMTDFEFKGKVEHINYADLDINLKPKMKYNNGKLTKVVSDIKVSRAGEYLDGIVEATPTTLTVELTNQIGNEFKLVSDDDEDGNVVAEKSYIKNKKGEKIARITPDGLIYYIGEDGESGEIGSIY